MTNMAPLGALVADVDLTLIPDGSSPLSGRNLALVAETLRRGVPVLLISGSPFDDVYCGTRSAGALGRRVAAPLRAALERSGRVDAMSNLAVYYVSGRGRVSFAETGEAIRHPDRVDKDIGAPLQAELFRTLLAGFYVAFRPDADVRSVLDAADEPAEATAARVRAAIRAGGGPDVGPLERWSFESELNLVFHGARAAGDAITAWARRSLEERNVPLPPDLHWAGGPDYAKALRIRKRDTIEEALAGLERDGRLPPGRPVVAVGDSTADDFLLLSRPDYVPLYLGAADAVRDHPAIRVIRDDQGRDRQHAAGFATAFEPYLTGGF